MKSRGKSRNKKLIARVRKLRGRLPANVDVVQAVREVRQSPRGSPARGGRRTDSASVPGVNPLSNGSMLDAAGRFNRPADAPGRKKGGILKAPRRAPSGSMPRPFRAAKSHYITAADVLADLPPPELARKLRVDDRAPYTAGHWAWDAPRGRSWVDEAPRGFVAHVRKKVRRTAVDVESTVANWNRFAAEHGSFVDGLLFSDHIINDLRSLLMNARAAQRILKNPALIKRARSTLERWISKQAPAPRALLEWRDILAGTPQQIAAVAMSMTQEATRLRSSSPLGFVLTPAERSTIKAVFGRTTPEAHPAEFLKAGKPKKFARILAQAIKTFGSQDAAQTWLNSPVISLEMKRPIDMLATNEGAQLVEDLLGRIDADVLA